MIFHLPQGSTVNPWFSATRRFFLCWALLAFLTSCASSTRPALEHQLPSTPPDNPRNVVATAAEYNTVAALTDEILLALASRGHRSLEHFAPPADPPISGSDIADRLLGRHAGTLVLQRWNAEQIEVTFDTALCRASARVPVVYRPAPNRKPITATFLLRFHRLGPTDRWLLSLD